MPFQKRAPYRNNKILNAAKGEQCTMNLHGVCNGDSSTVVFAHSNLSEDGKGFRQKADDCFGAFLCSACHDAYDHRTLHPMHDWKEIEYEFFRAMKRTWRRLIDKGVIK